MKNPDFYKQVAEVVSLSVTISVLSVLIELIPLLLPAALLSIKILRNSNKHQSQSGVFTLPSTLTFRSQPSLVHPPSRVVGPLLPLEGVNPRV